MSSVLIPLSSCNQAADTLVEWFGPEELRQVVGGQRWWQVRGLDGIEAEWVTERKNLAQVNLNTTDTKRKLSRQEELIVGMNELEPVMVRISVSFLAGLKECLPQNSSTSMAVGYVAPHNGTRSLGFLTSLGGYFWGSISMDYYCLISVETRSLSLQIHIAIRYCDTVSRYWIHVGKQKLDLFLLARKFHGRVFTVNYRYGP